MLDQVLTGLDRLGPVNFAATPEPYQPGRLLPPLREGQEFHPSWDPDTAYDEALGKCAMVDRCTTGLAEKGASVPLRVWERVDGGKPTIVGDHDLDVILNHPSDDPVMGSLEELVTRTIIHQKIIGTALTGIGRGVDILADEGATRPTGLVAEDPRQVYPIPSAELKVARWNYRDGDGQTKAWAREDLVCWKRHNPRNAVWGRSVLEALAMTVDSSVEASRTTLLRLTRDGRPGMVISDASLTDPDKRKDAEDALNARQRRSRGGIMLLGGSDGKGGAGQTLVANGMSESDLGLLANAAFDRDMIAIAYGYLPAGFSNEASTYANSGIFVLHEWALVQQTMASWCSQLTAFLFSREDQKRFLIAPDYSEVQVLADANMDKLKTLTAAAFKGVSTNDLIRTLGLPIPLQRGGDRVLVPSKLQDLAGELNGSDDV